ncbi:flavoprotein [Streptomyces sp. NPDC055897]
MKRLDHAVLGVTGSSSAAGLEELVALLERYVAQRLSVLCTPDAVKFVRDTTVPFLTNADWQDQPLHTSLAAEADLLVIAPATANTLAKCALGLADNLVTATFLASPRPAIVVPATNRVMWEAPTTKRHVADLRARGHHVLEPGPEVAISTGVLGDACSRTWRSAVAEIVERYALH